MRILLISPNTERITMPTLPLGLALVGAASRAAGHDVSFLNLMFVDAAPGAVERAAPAARPDVIGISVRNIDDQVMEGTRFLLEPTREVVAACRRSADAPVVVGGAGYSIFPQAALAFLDADIGVAGEGEQSFPAVLACLEAGQDPAGLPGVFLRGRGGARTRGTVADLDWLPAPADDAWPGGDMQEADTWVPVQSRRGCPLACSYCSTPVIEGTVTRTRSPQIVVDEIRRATGRGFSHFYFVDNTFNVPSAYALDLCRRISAMRLGVQWRCILYPHDVSDELIGAMAAAGCVEASIGFESGSLPVLTRMNKRFTPGEVRRISDGLAAHGIRRHGFLLLGGPGETAATANESLAFAESLGLDSLKTTIGIRIYPGTPLERIAREEGQVDAGDDLLRPRFYVARGLEDWIRSQEPSNKVQ